MTSVVRHPASWLLLSYVLLGVALELSGGFFLPSAFWVTAASFGCCLVAWLATVCTPHAATDDPPVAFGGLLFAALALYELKFARGLYVASSFYQPASFFLLIVVAVTAVTLVLTRHRPRHALRATLVATVFAGGVAILLLMPVVSPKPHIDVHYMLQTVAERFSQGENPYTTVFPDLYEGKGASKPLTTYTYPPGNILLLLPFWALFGDVRFGLAAGVLLWLYATWKSAKRDAVWAQLLLLLGIFQSRIQFVVEQSWIDPLLLGVLAGALILHERQKQASALAYGFFLGLKQYLVFFLPHFWLLDRRPTHWLLLGLGGIAAFVPFFLWNADATLQNGILFHLSDTFRSDSLTLISFLHPYLGWEPSRGWSLLVGGAFCVATLFTCRKLPPMQGFLLATMMTTYAVFFLGSQGFGNYYFFVAGLQLLLLSRMGQADA